MYIYIYTCTSSGSTWSVGRMVGIGHGSRRIVTYFDSRVNVAMFYSRQSSIVVRLDRYKLRSVFRF